MVKRDFVAELKARIAAFDNPVQKRETAIVPMTKRFNVHKRSLPPGIDRIVFFNVSKEEAELLSASFLRARAYQDSARETKTVIYYDIIPVGAKPRERSIYFNEREITREGGSEPVTLEIVRDTSLAEDLEWIPG